MQIRVQISKKGALRNQRYAFSDRYTLISELMQNARRAGATEVRIDYDETTQQLLVSDDGFGIFDFQKLLTFNDSGWDEGTRQEERPFGIGFSKCLYSASRCIVRSFGQQIDFQTEMALAQSSIEVAITDEVSLGTQICLFDVDLPFLEHRIPKLAKGFAIPVIFNGKHMPRPHAPDALPYVETEIGRVWITGTENGDSTHDTMIYLQGFCVLEPTYFRDGWPINVVHLDSRRFTARLPDRDQLIDEDEQKTIINETLKRVWRDVLLEKKEALPATDFLDTFFSTVQGWGHIDLLNDVPVLPRQLCSRIIAYPYQEGMADRNYLGDVKGHITREAIEKDLETLVELDDTSEDNMAYWMYARAHGFVVFEHSLAEGHWVNGYVCYLDEAKASVEIIGEQCRGEFSGRWACTPVVIAEAYAITIGDVRVVIDDGALYNGSLAIIPQSEISGAVCAQISDYTDENGYFFENDRTADIAAMRDFIRLQRVMDPELTLRSLLAELALEKYSPLHGKTFIVKVGATPDAHDMTLVD